MFLSRSDFTHDASSDGCHSPRVSSPDSHYTLAASSPLSVRSDPGMSSQPYTPNYYSKQDTSWSRQQYYGENNNLYNKYDYKYKSQRAETSTNSYSQNSYYKDNCDSR